MALLADLSSKPPTLAIWERGRKDIEAAYVVMVTGHWVAVRGKWFCDTFAHGASVRIEGSAAQPNGICDAPVADDRIPDQRKGGARCDSEWLRESRYVFSLCGSIPKPNVCHLMVCRRDPVRLGMPLAHPPDVVSEAPSRAVRKLPAPVADRRAPASRMTPRLLSSPEWPSAA